METKVLVPYYGLVEPSHWSVRRCLSDPWSIARQLSRINRFAGMGYSVAQHSLALSELFEEPTMKLAALLHDVPEMFLGDVPKNVKTHNPLEDQLLKIAYECYKVPFEAIPPDVACMDAELGAAEMWIFCGVIDPPVNLELSMHIYRYNNIPNPEAALREKLQEAMNGLGKGT